MREFCLCVLYLFCFARLLDAVLCEQRQSSVVCVFRFFFLCVFSAGKQRAYVRITSIEAYILSLANSSGCCYVLHLSPG